MASPSRSSIQRITSVQPVIYFMVSCVVAVVSWGIIVEPASIGVKIFGKRIPCFLSPASTNLPGSIKTISFGMDATFGNSIRSVVAPFRLQVPTRGSPWIVSVSLPSLPNSKTPLSIRLREAIMTSNSAWLSVSLFMLSLMACTSQRHAFWVKISLASWLLVELPLQAQMPTATIMEKNTYLMLMIFLRRQRYKKLCNAQLL